MTIELRDLIAILALLVSAAGMILVSRNARRATGVNEQQLTLARVRDLRNELTETETKLKGVNEQLDRAGTQLEEAEQFGRRMLMERMEMIRYAQMPGMDIGQWLARYGDTDNPRPVAGGVPRA